MAEQRRDLELTVQLLWRGKRPGSRGPRGSLTLDEIVGTAIAIAEDEGLAGVSMRKIAERLGVTTMTLYRYVPGKEDLLDLMFDMGTGPPPAEDWPEGWREGLSAYARATYEKLLAHPWLLDIPLQGPPLGPNNLAWMESALAVLEGTHLRPDQKIGVLMLVTGFCLSEARMSVSLERSASHTGVTYEEWGRVYERLLRDVVRSGRFPSLARVLADGAFAEESEGPVEDFEYGLAILLDGIAALMRANALDSPGGAGGRPAPPAPPAPQSAQGRARP